VVLGRRLIQKLHDDDASEDRSSKD
jgi:hypothetical protein